MNTIAADEKNDWTRFLGERLKRDLTTGASCATVITDTDIDERFKLAERLNGVRTLPTYVDPQLPEGVRTYLSRDGITSHLEAALIDGDRTLFVPDCIPEKLENIAESLGRFFKPECAPVFTGYFRTPGRTVIEISKNVPVFVYGTLLSGENRHRFLSESNFEGADKLDDHTMFAVGDYPAISVGDGSVVGELYTVPAQCLWALDRIEGCPGLFRRKWVTLNTGREAWAYIGNNCLSERLPVIESGDWRAFQNQRTEVVTKWEN
jgi:gamma-glutamylcyclotransferase (GGCT)/AIG2-like uncharacterized protein YtfP